MLRCPLAFFVPFAATTGFAAAQRPQPGSSALPDFRRALETLLAGFVEAYNRKDVAQLEALCTEDAVLVPSGPILAGKRDIAQHYRTRLEHCAVGLRIEVTQAQAEGGDPAWAVAWAVGRCTVMMPGEGGRPQEHRGNFSTLFRRQGDGRLIRVHAFNFLPGSAPPQLR